MQRQGVGRYSREAALSEQLHCAPCHPVRGHDRGVAGGERTLHQEGKNDLVPDMLDLVDKGWYDPAAKNTGHRGRDHGNTNLYGVVRKGVQRDLRG